MSIWNWQSWQHWFLGAFTAFEDGEDDLKHFEPEIRCHWCSNVFRRVQKGTNDILRILFILFFILAFPFPQINPQNTVPFLIDRDKTLNESRAICTYLITNYAKGKLKNLYPKDNLGQRTKIDQKLNYDKFYEALKDDYVGKNQWCQFCLFQFF